MSSKSISAEEFAFDILQVLFDQSLTNDSFLILSDVIELATEQAGIEVPDDIKKAAVNHIYSGHFVEIWDDPQNGRSVKINRAGMTEVQTNTANRRALEASKKDNYWLVPLILILLALGIIGFLLWKFGVFGR